MIHARRITLKKIITLFGIVVVALHISSYTDCMTMPHPAVPPPDDVPPPAEQAVQAPAEPEKPQPVEQAVQAPPKPEEPQPVEQVAQAPAEPEEPQPDMSPPEVSVVITPQPYCPINPDGEEQLLTANIHVKSASPIDAWYIELRDPESNEVFLSLAQKGKVPETLTWNGRNDKDELAESATVYKYSLTVTNIYGSTTCPGTLAIDVVAIKEGKNLFRIIIPSIIFAPNTVELTKGLDPATSAGNDRILRRIADILNYFGTYKVRVEGHANPTFAPDSVLRAGEERGTGGIIGLQSVSEQRAKAVVEYLVKLGINRSRLTPIGMGGRSVRTEFDDKPNWWKNRRVEFILEKPESDE